MGRSATATASGMWRPGGGSPSTWRSRGRTSSATVFPARLGWPRNGSRSCSTTAAYSLGGWSGVNAFALLLVAVTIALLNWFCLGNFRFTIAIGVTALAAVFAYTHYLARPHLVAYPIMLIWTIAVVGAANRQEVPRWWLLPLMTLWANLHGGFTLGLVIAGFMSLETVLAASGGQRRKRLVQHGLFLLLAVLATLITPFGIHSILITEQIFGLGEVLDRVNEWKSPRLSREPISPLYSARARALRRPQGQERPTGGAAAAGLSPVQASSDDAALRPADPCRLGAAPAKSSFPGSPASRRRARRTTTRSSPS